jgi:lactoylglutathione lyase
MDCTACCTIISHESVIFMETTPVMLKILTLGAVSLFLTASAVFAQTQKPVLEHIAVYVEDLQKSTSFYRDVIHLDTLPEPFHDGRHTWFNIGGHSALHIIQGAKSVTAHDKNSHLCFTVASVTAFIDGLNRAGVPYENWAGAPQSVTNRVDGVKQIYFKDPDGYWIEVNDAK